MTCFAITSIEDRLSREEVLASANAASCAVRVLEKGQLNLRSVSMHACLQNHQIARVRRGYAVEREHGQARSSTPIMSLQPPSFPSPRCSSTSYNYLSMQAHLRLLLRFSARPNLVYFVQAPSRLALPGKTQKGPSPIPVSDPVGCTSVSWCADHLGPWHTSDVSRPVRLMTAQWRFKDTIPAPERHAAVWLPLLQCQRYSPR